MALRLFAASEIFFRPSALSRRLELPAFTGGFFAALGAAFRSTVSFARPTDAFAESSNSRKLLPFAAYWSMTLESIVSTLVSRFRAFFAFILLLYHIPMIC